jgi:hypothetical protein
VRSWRFPIVVLVPVVIVAGIVAQQRVGTGTTTSADANVDITRVMPVAQRAGVASSTFYCVGGTATGQSSGFAEQTVSVANFSSAEKHGTLTVYANVGDPVTRSIVVPPDSRIDTRLADVRQADYASAIVEIEGGEVAVEHTVSGPTGHATSPCSSSPSDTWYFPSGSTRPGAREVLVVFNPFPDPAVIDITFETDDGARTPQKLNPLVVLGGKVAGVDITDTVTLRPQIATTVRTRTGSGRVVVDQLQSFDGKDGLKNGDPISGPSATAGTTVPGTTGTTGPVSTTPVSTEPVRDAGVVGLAVTAGASTPVSTWVFPNGPQLADGIDERYVVMNPGDATVHVAVQVNPDGGDQFGPVEPYELTVRGGEYESLSLRSDSRVPVGSGHWVSVVSRDGPIVAAQVVTAVAPASPVGFSLTPGSPLLATRWLVAAADDDRTTTADVTVVNPSATDAVQITTTSVRQGQAAPIEHFERVELGPGARTIVPAHEQGAGTNLAVSVESSGVVVVEHGLAWDQGGFSAAMGEPVVGTSARATVAASSAGPGALDVLPAPSGTAPLGGDTVPAGPLGSSPGTSLEPSGDTTPIGAGETIPASPGDGGSTSTSTP